jgi:signal transduction histidine kinase
MLLTLAKEPARLAEVAHPVDLAELLPDIVRDHSHLAAGKDLQLRLGTLAPAVVHAPIQVLQVAIGNLLRNAIENSDSGVIDVEAPEAGVVRIRDPGHGMAPEEIGRLYAALARGGELRGAVGGGLGLELIRRLCEHLGWTLEIQSGDAGTSAELDLRVALVQTLRPGTGDIRLQEPH